MPSNFFIRNANDPRTPEQHSSDIFHGYIEKSDFAYLMGKKDSGMPIILDTTSFRQPNEQVIFHFIGELGKDSIDGQDKTVTGNEESLEEFTDSVKVDQVAKAVKKIGKMTDQRIIWKFREEGKRALINFWKWKNDDMLFAALNGYITDGVTDLRKDLSVVNSTALVKGANRCVMAKTVSSKESFEVITASNSNNTSLLSNIDMSGGKMNTVLLDELSIIATDGDRKIQPVRMNSNGQEMYFLLLSKQAARDLRQNAAFQKHRIGLVEAGLDPAKDPWVSGALGVWNNIILKETSKVERVSNSDSSKTMSRNLLLGANAAVNMWAQQLEYVEDYSDYKRIFGMNSDEIRGVKKLCFDNVDVGVMQVITAGK